MAEETLILHIDTGQMQRDLEATTADLIKARNAKRELDKAYKEGKIELEQYTKESIKLTAETKKLQQQQSAQTKALDLSNKITEEAEGSNNQLRAQLALLTTQYNALSKEERENSEIGKELTRQTKEISDALKVNEGAVGDNRRNVGNYAEAVQTALGRTGTFGEKVGELTAILNDAKATLGSLVSYYQDLNEKSLESAQNAKAAATATQAQSVATTALGTATAGTTVAVGLGTKAWNLFKVAMIGTGIGAFIVVLGSLIAFLTQTREGIDAVNRITGTLSATFNVLIDRSVHVGRALVQIFTGDVKGAYESATKAVSGLGAEISNDIKLTRELKKEQEDLERQQIMNMSTNKRLLGDVERLKNIRDNEFNSIQERNKANEEAYRIEKSRLDILGKLAQDRINLIVREIALRGETTKEDLRRLEEAKNELEDLREDAAGKQNELITNRYQLEQERIEKLKELEAERIEERRRALELEIAQAAKGTDAEFRARIKMLEFERDVVQAQYKKNSVGYLLAQEEYQQKALELADKYYQELEVRTVAKIEKISDAITGTVSATTNEENFKLFASQIDRQMDKLTEEQELKRKYAEEAKRINAENVRNIEETTEAIRFSFGEQSIAYKAAFKLRQLVAIADAKAALPGILAANKSAGAKISAMAPPVTIPLGIAYTVGADIAAYAAIAKQVTDLLNIKLFRYGGVLDGPTHEKGGIPLVNRSGRVMAVAEGGEPILTRAVSKDPRLLAAASAINVAAGGNPLTVNNYMANGGITSNATTFMPDFSNMPAIDYNRLADAVAQRPVIASVRDVSREQEIQHRTRTRTTFKQG